MWAFFIIILHLIKIDLAKTYDKSFCLRRNQANCVRFSFLPEYSCHSYQWHSTWKVPGILWWARESQSSFSIYKKRFDKKSCTRHFYTRIRFLHEIRLVSQLTKIVTCRLFNWPSRGYLDKHRVNSDLHWTNMMIILYSWKRLGCLSKLLKKDSNFNELYVSCYFTKKCW